MNLKINRLLFWIVSVSTFLILNSAFAIENLDYLTQADLTVQDGNCPISAQTVESLRDGGIDILGKTNEMTEGAVVTRWKPVRSLQRHDACHYLFRLCVSAFGSPFDCGTGEAAAISWPRNAIKAVSFESVFSIPQKIIAGIGSMFGPECGPDTGYPCGSINPKDQMFYAEFSGDSARDIIIAKEFQFFYWGLDAKISATKTGLPDGRASFDPNLSRTWKLKNATFRLNRGQSAEALDVYSGYLDFDFDAYFKGSGGAVAPWSAGLRRIKEKDGTWTDVVLKM